ncbi:toxin glutamine deamidase domain-containing protein [Micromonospora sp. CPCC 205561]|uniref:toxin glutamine deamidase domain-containing protein n=1 Tax=Micromonospora sp. CPCC 205561 TaxID=3122407 RepID=UPI002FEEF551
MSLLPSPVPHPLDYSPWQLPGWVYEALDWVIGVEWPEGNERAVWDLADQWYAVATALAGPRVDALAAAGEVRAGYGGVGAVAAAFDTAWRRVAEGDEAPLPVLLAVSTELGRLVEECGCDIEGAKLEVWIELGILVVELLALAVATVLTAGAASPAAGAAITATRLIVQQIFKRLMTQLARKSLKQGLKEAGERAAKEVTKGGMRGFSRRAALSGVSEAAEESGINLATQAYQNSTGRRHGLDVTELGTTALGGLAGGAVAPLAGLGRHATGRGARVGEHFGREMAGEVMADQAASLATGQGLTSVEDAARAAASGARGSATSQADAALRARLDGQLSALAGGSLAPTESVAPIQTSTSVVGSTSGAEVPRQALSTPGVAASVATPSADVTAIEARSPSTLPPPDAGAREPGLVPQQREASSTVPIRAFADLSATAPVGPATEGLPAENRDDRPSVPGLDPNVDRFAAPASRIDLPTSPSDLTLSSVVPDAPPTAAHATSVTPSAIGEPASSAGPAAQNSGSTTAAASTAAHPVTALHQPHASTVASPLSGLPAQASPVTIGAAVSAEETRTSRPQAGGTGPLPHLPQGAPFVPEGYDRTSDPASSPSRATGQPPPRPRTPEWYAARWAADRDAFERRRYRGHFEFQRTNHEQNRRLDSAARLRQAADRRYDEARWLISEGRRLAQAGHRATSERFFREGSVRERWCHQQRDLADEVLAGTAAPVVVAIGEADFRRINDDVGDLAHGAVETPDRSGLTGDDHPPPIDRSRNYGQPGGLRPPLALHQTDIERRVPREPDGSVRRTADPRLGGWFGLVNDGGPQADPTRAINCIDCTLSLFDTWMHGRPRVAAPRTFDAYVAGDVTRPINGERDGMGRVEDITGGRFQRLCQPTEDVQGAERQRAIDTGYRNLHDQLRIGGHGSFAFIINSWERGGSHIWVALNQNGTILYLDPQTGIVSDAPLYTHGGTPHPYNTVDTEVLVLGGDGRPMPLGGLRRGRFSQRPDLPEYPPVETDQGYGEPHLNRLYLLDGPGSAPSEGSAPAERPPQPGQPGPVDDRDDDPLAGLRAARERAQVERESSGTPVSAVLASAPGLEQVFVAGVTPAEVAAGLDPRTLQRLVPQLDETEARDVARLFADPRVRRMLDDTWRNPPRRESMLAETLVSQLVRRPDLARMILATPELANSLTARPMTLHSLSSHQQAIDALGSVLDDIRDRGVEAVAVETVSEPVPTPLTSEQRRISARYPSGEERALQPGFDVSRKGDSKYRRQYLDQLYVSAAEAQREVLAVAGRVAADTSGHARPAGRPKPKERSRAEDKIAKYRWDVSMLTDLAAAKVVFRELSDLYAALDVLDQYEGVEIVEFEDRFISPQGSGYRDIQMMLRMSNGHIAEFRLHLQALDDVASWEHALYQVRRDLKAVAKEQGRSMSGMERALWNGVLKEEQQHFWRALQTTLGGGPHG